MDQDMAYIWSARFTRFAMFRFAIAQKSFGSLDLVDDERGQRCLQFM
jgi:hypothetical protein